MGSCCWTRDHRLSTLSTWSESLLKMADIFNISSDPVRPHQELQEEPSKGSHHHLQQGLLHHPGQKRFHWTRPNQEFFPTSHPLIQDLHSSQWYPSTPISILTTSPPPVPPVFHTWACSVSLDSSGLFGSTSSTAISPSAAVAFYSGIGLDIRRTSSSF